MAVFIWIVFLCGACLNWIILGMPLSTNNAVSVAGINKIPNKSNGEWICIMDIIIKKQTGITSSGRMFGSICLIDRMPKTKTGIIIHIKKYSA